MADVAEDAGGLEILEHRKVLQKIDHDLRGHRDELAIALAGGTDGRLAVRRDRRRRQVEPADHRARILGDPTSLSGSLPASNGPRSPLGFTPKAR